LVRPVTEIGDDAAEPVILLGVDVAVKVLTAAPPVAPAVKVTDAVVLAPVAVPIVGACGIVVAVTALVALDGVPVPTLLIAATVNVYETPDAKPVTEIGDAVPVAVIELGVEVTM
jgi:hypothetical protein